jgi:predicted Rossmann fold flavoprotein
LERRLKEAGVRIELETEVLRILPLGPKGFSVTVLQKGNKRELPAESVIVCTGGLSYPSTGSTGDGYRFAKDAGLDIRPCSPALVPLTVEEDCSCLQGVSLKNVSIRISEASGGKTVYESEPGELLFTHFGLSGPLILTASSLITGGISAGKRYLLHIDLKPGLAPEKLDDRLLRDFQDRQNMQVENALGKLLIASLRPVIVQRAAIDPLKRVRDITKKERLRLAEIIKGLSFTISGTRGYSEAVITQGGVSTTEIDPKTMECKRCPGLYFAGEVLDVDAFTGGFNLQIAWSTGHAAGAGCG